MTPDPDPRDAELKRLREVLASTAARLILGEDSGPCWCMWAPDLRQAHSRLCAAARAALQPRPVLTPDEVQAMRKECMALRRELERRTAPMKRGPFAVEGHSVNSDLIRSISGPLNPKIKKP